MLTNIITNLDKIIAEVQKVTPHNIREGVEIFGVEGSLQEILTQHKHVSPKVFSQLVVPDVEYNALHEVIIDGVTNDIDSNIISNNIRYGKRILGIQGILSELTEQEYQDMLLLEIEILGYNKAFEWSRDDEGLKIRAVNIQADTPVVLKVHVD